MPKTKIEPTAIDDLPKFIRILHSTYSLNSKSSVTLALSGRLGEIDFNEKEINFLDLDGSDTADTIIHEVFHGLWHAFDLGDEEDSNEEHIVRTLATGLVTVMMDNPELMLVLQKMVDESRKIA